MIFFKLISVVFKNVHSATWYQEISGDFSSTLCPNKNAHIFIFLNNSVKNEPLLTIFGTRNAEGT